MAIGGMLEALAEQLEQQIQSYNGGRMKRKNGKKGKNGGQLIDDDQQQQHEQQQLQQQLQQLQQQQMQQLGRKPRQHQSEQQYQGGQQQIAGNVKVYTGPKQGKFIINRHGKKVYIDRKTINNNIPYIKKKPKARK